MPTDKSSEMFASPRNWPMALAAPASPAAPGLVEDHGLFRRPARLSRGVAAAPRRAGAVDRLVVQVMSIDLLTTVILQRISLGVSITLGTHLIAMAVLFFSGRTKTSALRMVLYWLFWGSALALQFISGNTFSSTSLLLGVACYATFLVVVPSSQETYFQVIKAYQQIAMGVCVIVFLDLALQVAGLGMPNMNAIVPVGITTQTMNYIQPLTWGAGIDKPNAFFMMEASYTSQFIAIALLIELAFFRRWAWVIGFALGLLGTFSGTGLMLILLTLPVLARRFWRSFLIYGLVLMPLLSGVAVATGWYEIAAKRVASFDNKNSSSYGRFIGPFVAMDDVMSSGNQDNIVYGFGAGKTAFTEVIPGLDSIEYNAISKTFLEYGFIVTVFMMVFTTYCFFSNGAPFLIALAAALEYHLMGGHLLMPTILNYSYILAAGWAIKPLATRETSRGQRSSEIVL